MTPTTTQITGDLTKRLRAKEPDAFSQLYESHASAIFGIIMRLIKHKQTGEEILQDVFVKIWLHIESYDPAKGSLFTWMHTITRNCCLDYLRSSRHVQEKREYKFGGLWENKAGGNVWEKEFGTELRELTRRLLAENSVIINMVYFMGYTQLEVSRELKIPLGTVKTKCRASLQKLRSALL